jgi:hypothetical protein
LSIRPDHGIRSRNDGLGINVKNPSYSLKLKTLKKTKTEIPKHVRDDKKRANPVVMLNLVLSLTQYRFSIWLDFLLPLADGPFIPVPAYRQAGTGRGSQARS